MNVERVSTMPLEGGQQSKPGKRKPAISPELREVLHMLKSLEAELAVKQPPAR